MPKPPIEKNKESALVQKAQDSKLEVSESMVSKNKQVPRHTIKWLWKVHFSMGLVAVCLGMFCNGGRKYVPADPLKAPSDLYCNKLYVNVFSSSHEDEGAMICCNDDLEDWQQLFSYDGFLCNKTFRSMPLSRSLTRFPDCWLLPLIPIVFRILIGAFGKLSQISLHQTSDIWTSIKRMIFYLCIFQFRGWGLYICFNMIEDIIFQRNSNSLDVNQEQSELCWYTPLLKNRWRDNDPCHGLVFDFSDHVVFFLSHHFPCIIFEALFCFLFPFWPIGQSRKRVSDDPHSTTKSEENSFLLLVFNTVLPVGLLVAFIYLNIMTLIVVHSTAAYFHSFGEVVVGYTISLIIQIPVGLILWGDGWKRTRHFVGFLIDRDHIE